MNNPQINSLNSIGELQTLERDILNVLQKYSHIAPLCSHEILGLASLTTLSAIVKCSKPQAGGYSIPSSWIGSVASYMSKHQQILQTTKDCKYCGCMDEAWYL